MQACMCACCAWCLPGHSWARFLYMLYSWTHCPPLQEVYTQALKLCATSNRAADAMIIAINILQLYLWVCMCGCVGWTLYHSRCQRDIMSALLPHGATWLRRDAVGCKFMQNKGACVGLQPFVSAQSWRLSSSFSPHGYLPTMPCVPILSLSAGARALRSRLLSWHASPSHPSCLSCLGQARPEACMATQHMRPSWLLPTQPQAHLPRWCHGQGRQGHQQPRQLPGPSGSS